MCPVRKIRRLGCVSQGSYEPDLCLDGGGSLVGGGKQHKVLFREVAIWSAIWVSVSFFFAAALWWHLDGSAGRDVADRFSLLKYGLAAVLVFIGVKVLLIDLYKIPIGFSLAVVATFIGISIGMSLRKERLARAAAAARAGE